MAFSFANVPINAPIITPAEIIAIPLLQSGFLINNSLPCRYISSPNKAKRADNSVIR